MTATAKSPVAQGAQHTSARLPTPAQVRRACPATSAVTANAGTARTTIHAILHHRDPRLLVVVGPCSVHDPTAAIEFGTWLRDQQKQWREQLFLVMRAYVEKPRTRFGWNGLMHDPTLNGSGRIDEGIHIARKLFVDLHAAGIPAATEFVDVITAPFLDDVVSWVAIGARTAESPTHRHMASGLPCPAGFKNGTEGSLSVAIDGVAVARTGHRVVGIDQSGRVITMQTRGNPASHVILRGGHTPNHDPETIATVCAELHNIGAPARLLIDCSHGNANQPGGQAAAFESVARQLRSGTTAIMGVMLESNLVAGCQPLDASDGLVYGQSITDPCLGLDDTSALLRELACQQRRSA